MFKYNANTLKKFEDAFKEGGYLVRYEKGNFHAGYCVLQDKKVVVVNKYFTTEARINCLLDILQTVDIQTDNLSEASKFFLNKVLLEKE